MGSGEVIETQRLVLRRFRPDDLETLIRWHSDPGLMAHMGKPGLTREETEAAFAGYERHWERHGFGLLAAEDRETGALVGRTGVAFHRAWPSDPEVGWMVDPAWQGKGLATEAGEACVAYAFEELGLARVVSICLPGNAASRRVMEKLGFSLLERVRDPIIEDLLWVHARRRAEGDLA